MASGRALSARRVRRDEHESPGRARCRLLQQARNIRTIGSRKAKARSSGRGCRAGRSPPMLRGSSFTRSLEPRQFLADAGDAGTDQGLVTDKLEGKADQDRRQGREPRTLCRLSDGRGRHPTANVPEDSAAHCRNCGRSHHQRQRNVFDGPAFKRATDGKGVSQCQGKWPDQPLDNRSGCPRRRQPSAPPACLAKTSEKRKNLCWFESLSGEYR